MEPTISEREVFQTLEIKNELDDKYGLDVRGGIKGCLGKCLLEQLVPLNEQRLTLVTEQKNYCKSNKYNLSTYLNTSVINLIST